jgi:hypothetical protein
VLNLTAKKKSRLETIIERRQAKTKAAEARWAKTKVLEKKKKDRVADEEFHQNFRKMFARLRKLVRCTRSGCGYDFTYKDYECRIVFEHWHIPQDGVDTWDIDGDSWKLQIPMHGSIEIVDIKEIVAGKDYTSKVIEILEEQVK